MVHSHAPGGAIEWQAWQLGVSATTPRGAAFSERLAAAASLGLTHIGITPAQAAAEESQGRTPSQLRDIAAKADLGIDSVEILHRAGEADPDGRSEAALDRLLSLAEAVGATRLLVAAGAPENERVAAASLRRVCRRAGECGVDVVLEFVPWTTISDLAAATRLVERAGEPNGGIVLDCWHFFRGTADLDAISRAPEGMIREVQLCDGLLGAELDDPLEETLRRRKLPGEGEFALRALLEAVADHHGAVPLTLEVFSDELAAMPVDAALRQMWTAAQRLLGECNVASRSTRERA